MAHGEMADGRLCRPDLGQGAGDDVKRGRKALDPISPSVNMTIRVPATLADAMFVLAHRRHTSVSAITRELYREEAKAITPCKDCASDHHGASLKA